MTFILHFRSPVRESVYILYFNTCVQSCGCDCMRREEGTCARAFEPLKLHKNRGKEENLCNLATKLHKSRDTYIFSVQNIWPLFWSNAAICREYSDKMDLDGIGINIRGCTRNLKLNSKKHRPRLIWRRKKKKTSWIKRTINADIDQTKRC